MAGYIDAARSMLKRGSNVAASGGHVTTGARRESGIVGGGACDMGSVGCVAADGLGCIAAGGRRESGIMGSGGCVVGSVGCVAAAGGCAMAGVRQVSIDPEDRRRNDRS